jgi:subtilisin family serine protease
MLAATLLAVGVAQTQPAMDDADHYIVVLEDDVDSPSQVAHGIEQRQNLEVGFVYTNALEGFSATIPDERLDEVRANPQVDYVERDTTVHAVAVQTLPWGIDKIDADESSTVAGDHSGVVSNVNAYIIDTGIDKGHRDLNVVGHVNFYGEKNTDCDGHGTHVAGTVAAKDNYRGVVGVAPGAPLTGVKVLDCNGDGPSRTVIKGIDWVTENAQKPAIANLSLSSEANEALDDAVRRSAASGVFYSVAAGNYGKKACDYSPAAAGRTWDGTEWIYDNGIATTAAVNDSREEIGLSNYGSCVDLWAPGKDILSTKNEGGTSKLTGTSMAAPHVGGTAALYLSNPNNAGAAPATVEDILKVDAARVQGEEKRSKDGSRIKVVYAGDY